MPLFPNIFNPNAKILNIFYNKEFYGQDLSIACSFCTFKRKNMVLFEEYKNHPDPFVRERATNWATAIGLQRVDELSVSDFLIQVAHQEINGKITMDDAQAMISEHYTQL